ncbi:YgjV family protein [Photobacterium sanctipauli]|uniref:YgjV family protein n=1 Tax=Photobacterium sanctipauli TaxID=1342794 RepID=A0A2T3NW66_9GAMM|nr:YgjV family protein [Photobacterium sanctipauli]PSW20468.1 YgjV family protein [Photobacterium sanctipauli]
MSAFVLSQIIIGIAVCFDLVSFQFKEKKNIIKCFVCAVTLIGIHFALLEQWTGAGLMALGALRYITSLYTTSKRMALLFCISTLVITFFTYAGIASIISCTAALVQNIAAFSKNDQRLRQLMIVGTSLWLAHNIVIGSPTAVALEALFLSSNLIGYYRYYIKPKSEQANPA